MLWSLKHFIFLLDTTRISAFSGQQILYTTTWLYLLEKHENIVVFCLFVCFISTANKKLTAQFIKFKPSICTYFSPFYSLQSSITLTLTISDTKLLIFCSCKVYLFALILKYNSFELLAFCDCTWGYSGFYFCWLKGLLWI